MNKHGLSDRTIFVIVFTITVVLLFGSLILQNIFFKADQVASSLFLSPTTFSVQPGGTVDLSIQSVLAGEAEVAGTQFTLRYDPEALAFVGAQAPILFETIKLVDSNGVLSWALVPKDGQGLLLKLKDQVQLGIVQFKALKNGAATVTLVQEKSSISAVDASQSPSLYNAISSVQDSSGIISSDPSAPPSVDAPAILAETTIDEQTYNAQRILSTDVVTAAKSGRVLVQTKYIGSVSVQFGPTPQVSSTLEGTDQTTDHSLLLSGLEPSTRYYYRVIVYSPDKKTAIRSQLRSFVTTEPSQTNIPGHQSELKVFPEVAKDAAELVATVKDEQSNSVEAPVEYKVVDGKATVTTLTSLPGLSVADVKSTATTKQTVTVAATSGGVELGRSTVTFDPSLVSVAAATYTPSASLPLNREILLLLFGSAAGMLLFGLLFFKLARVK